MEIYALLELDLQFGYISVGDFMDLRKLNYTEKDRQVRLAVILGVPLLLTLPPVISAYLKSCFVNSG